MNAQEGSGSARRAELLSPSRAMPRKLALISVSFGMGGSKSSRPPHLLIAG